MNTATIRDSAGIEHEIPCDFMMVSEDRVSLYMDYRSPTSNRIEIQATFYKPISVKFTEKVIPSLDHLKLK